jgi:hypothetical protein
MTMSKLPKFSSPAYLSDFRSKKGQAEAWHQLLDAWFESSIKSERPYVKAAGGAAAGTIQFYNPARCKPAGPLIEQPIIWNAFPKELLKRYGRSRALIEADRLEPLAQYSASYDKAIHRRTFYRPQNEYCEWHTRRDPNTQKITRIDFSSEPPEYWRAFFGGELEIDGGTVQFPGDRDKVLALYRELVSPAVQMDDLICQETIPGPSGQADLARAGEYNAYNKWNTTHGIVHLCSPPNALQAEIQLAADATILRADAAGSPVALPEPLICCSLYGGPDRNSDPTIGSSVNALARAGALLTLPNPVGLYMDHIDTSGWLAPDHRDLSDCVRIVRGAPGMIEHLTIEVPPERGFTVGDITIGGSAIHYGGQVAECISVKLVAAAAQLGTVRNAAIPCSGRCCIDPHNPVQLGRGLSHGTPNPAGTVNAFAYQGGLHAAVLLPGHSHPAPRFRHVRWVV